MKAIITAASIALVFTACNSNPKTVVTTTTTPLVDSTEMAAYREFKQQKVRDSIEAVVRGEQASAAAAAGASSSATRKTTPSRSYSSNASGSNSGTTTMNSESSNAAERRGMSKTAKGAIIGGVVGAGTGAVVNKKNRGAGAVVGGVVGAGAGAIIGRQKDKRDGRN